MDNYDSFKALLDEDEIHYMEDELDDGDRLFRIPQKLQQGAVVNIIVLFSKFKIKIAMLGIANVEPDDEDKKIEYYKFFNDFNAKYSFFKMYMHQDGDICVDLDLPLDIVEGEFQPKEVMGMIAMLLHTVGKVYRDIMKIQWA